MLSSLILAVSLSGSAQKRAEQQYAAAQQAAQAAVDTSMLQSLATMRGAAASGDPNQVNTWGGTLRAAVESGTFSRGKLTMEADIQPALDALEGAARKSSALAPTLLGTSAAIQLGVGLPAEAVSTAERALKAGTSTDALKTLLEARVASGAPADPAGACKGVRPGVKDDIQRFLLLDTCNAFSGASDSDAGLAWASADDRAFYKTKLAEQAERAAAREAERQARAAALSAAAAEAAKQSAAARASSASSASSSSSAGGPVSVSVHVSCSERVRLFRGHSPSSSGTYGWESPNSTVSYTVSAGDVICIADGSDKVQSCWTAGSGSASLDVSCGGFKAR